mmetsp:Transcript_8024/g.18753  ORF Transcript_8024/g.18753 Transcript_8024/m.18753 type:complete len:547 (-) Transcript_8024:2-1642(-)
MAVAAGRRIGILRRWSCSACATRSRLLAFSLVGVLAFCLQLRLEREGAAELSQAFGYGRYHESKRRLWNVKPLSSAKRKLALEKYLKAGLPQKRQPWGTPMAKDGTNVAVREEDTQALASEPLRLSVDRYGRIIEADGIAERRHPLSPYTDDLHSARAPASLEEYLARYEKLDRLLYKNIEKEKLDELEVSLKELQSRTDYRSVSTYAWVQADGSATSIVLIGVHPTLEESRNFAAGAVAELEPSALLVQLCKHRLGQNLVMPISHREAVADYSRSFVAGNPQSLEQADADVEVWDADLRIMQRWLSNLAYPMAVEEFTSLRASSDAIPRVLCLGDMPWAQLEEVRLASGAEALGQDPARSDRGQHIARSLVSMAGFGHKRVLGLVDIEMLEAVREWLTKAGAQLVATRDRSDYVGWREGLASDARAASQYSSSSPEQSQDILGIMDLPIGDFIDEDGLHYIEKRRLRLERLTRVADLVQHRAPPAKWEVAQLLGYSGQPNVPGPEGLLKQEASLLLEEGHLEIPAEYLRQAGMEKFAAAFWDRVS